MNILCHQRQIVVLIQARMGSTRFPGKMLAKLAGYPVLEWVLHRTSKAQLVDRIVLATTDQSRDDPLVELAKGLGISAYRGSESDVLERFAAAAREFDASDVVRICADNPFIDPVEVDRLVRYYFDNPCDYACNHQDRLGSAYADGFGAEILSNTLLQKISGLAVAPQHREHATSYLWDHLADYKLLAVPAPNELAYPALSFDVDTPADLLYLNAIAGMRGIDVTAAELVAAALQNLSN